MFYRRQYVYIFCYPILMAGKIGYVAVSQNFLWRQLANERSQNVYGWGYFTFQNVQNWYCHQKVIKLLLQKNPLYTYLASLEQRWVVSWPFFSNVIMSHYIISTYKSLPMYHTFIGQILPYILPTNIWLNNWRLVVQLCGSSNLT